jgi:excisionase family DNA binding protein
MESPWLTVKEAAARLTVHPQFIYEACAVMGLTHTRVGHGRGKIRIRQSWLDAWSEARVQRMV